PPIIPSSTPPPPPPLNLSTPPLPHPLMEERVPPPPGVPNPNSPHQPSSLYPTTPAFRPGTFIVRVPKDQIYRVPPPENALIIERHLIKRSCKIFIKLAYVEYIDPKYFDKSSQGVSNKYRSRCKMP
ncbi:hypothetical protein Ddye_006235, partial [Dipteronia dyeriana]